MNIFNLHILSTEMLYQQPYCIKANSVIKVNHFAVVKMIIPLMLCSAVDHKLQYTQNYLVSANIANIAVNIFIDAC